MSARPADLSGRALGALARVALRHPLGVLLGLALVSAGLGAGVLRLEHDAGFRAYVGSDHPTVRRLDRFVQSFGGGLPAGVVWSCETSAGCEHALDPDSLRMARAVADALERSDGVLAVESPATSALPVATPDGVSVRRLVEDGRVVGDLPALRAAARADPMWRGSLVSADGQVGALWVELASSAGVDNVRAMDALETALAPFRDRFAFHLVGAPVEFVVAGRDLERDTLLLVPAIVLLIGGVVAWLFRSLPVVLASLSCVGLSVVWSFGAMGWLGWPQTAVTQALAPFILVVGVCDAMHLVSRTVAECAGAGGDAAARRRALLRAVDDVAPACALTSLTTALGFLSFATSDAVSFVRFGVVAAVGVGSALVLSFSLLPILLARVRFDAARVRAAHGAWDAALARVVGAAQRRAAIVLVAAGALGALFSLGLADLRADVRPEHLFGERSDVVRWIRFVESHLRPTESVELALELPAGLDVRDPDALRILEAASAAVAAAPWSGAVRSMADVLDRIDRLDPPPGARLVERSASAVGERLLLAELHDPWLVRRWISDDERALRISAEVPRGGSRRDAVLLADLRSRLAAVVPGGWTIELTGPLPAALDMVEEVQRTQLRSFAGAALAVFAALVLGLRSFGWAALAMIPNLLPVVACLGAMGLWGVDLDMGTAMVGAVIMGIAVDDTIHLLTRYRRGRRAGAPAERAIADAAVHVGRALVTTSFALAAGFWVLTLSSWQSVASFGFLSSVAILLALAIDLTVLPALVAAVSRASRWRDPAPLAEARTPDGSAP